MKTSSSNSEYFRAVISRAINSPLKITCADKAAATRLRWNLYHHKHFVPGAETLRISIRGAEVHLDLRPPAILTIETLDQPTGTLS